METPTTESVSPTSRDMSKSTSYRRITKAATVENVSALRSTKEWGKLNASVIRFALLRYNSYDSS